MAQGVTANIKMKTSPGAGTTAIVITHAGKIKSEDSCAECCEGVKKAV
jgi:hypothetical protein